MNEKLVLVAEDHRPIAYLLRRLAERCGARANVAYDGRQALESMRSERPQLLLLDLVMPGMSGNELLRTMQSDPELQEVPVVVITTQENLEETLEHRVPHLCKPFAPAEVERLIRQALA